MENATLESTSAAESTAATTLRQIDALPGPRGLPVVVNLLRLDTPRLRQQLEGWCREFGPFFRLQLGSRRVPVVGDHAATASVLRDRPDGFRRTARLEEVWTEMKLQPGVFGANGDVWKRQRRMVMAGFDPAHVKRCYPAMLTTGQRLGKRWALAAQNNVAIDLQADLMRYTVGALPRSAGNGTRDGHAARPLRHPERGHA